MLFLRRLWEPIARGEVTVTFRRWKRQQVLAGRRYRTAAGIIQIESVTLWTEDDITDADARQAGHRDASSLLADLPARPGLPLYRVQFHVVDDPDPRAELAARANVTSTEILEILQRLERLDRASTHGPWTIPVLECPGPSGESRHFTKSNGHAAGIHVETHQAPPEEKGERLALGAEEEPHRSCECHRGWQDQESPDE